MKKQFWLLALLSVLAPAFASAQSADNFSKVWLQGSGVVFTSDFSVTPPANAYWDTLNLRFGHNNSNLCDSFGTLLFTANASSVYNADRQIIPNGDSIAPHFIDSFYQGDISYSQISIMLPFEDSIIKVIASYISDSLAAQTTSTNDTNAAYASLLYSHTISYKAADGFGKLVRKKDSLLTDGIMGFTRLTACRHGNGIDWWVVKGGYHQNRLYTFRITKDSAFGPFIQQYPEPYWQCCEYDGQAAFSRDGTKYAAVSDRNKFVFIADFDRCTGTFSNPQTIPVPDVWVVVGSDSLLETLVNGVAFAPGGQFLYVSRQYNIQQLDLQDANPATRWAHVAGLDTTYVASQQYSNIYPGPDGKLYIGNWNGLCAQMSTINNPNVKGTACGFCPKCMRFPRFYFSETLQEGGVVTPPNMPNYSLGPANPPCGQTAVAPLALQSKPATVWVSPNPTTGKIKVQWSAINNEVPRIRILDVYGRQVMEVNLSSLVSQQYLELGNQPAGLYYYQFFLGTQNINNGKIELLR